jgi:CP family cyanate transporter-like MFS transporter
MEKRQRALLVLGLLLVAFNFRPAITSVPPIVEAIRTDVGLSYTAVSLLTTIPTLLIGAFAFVATPVSRRVGRERAIFWAVLLLTVSTALRLWGANVGVLFGTTVLVGAGIAVSQALLPAVILDHFADRAALLTGLYTASLGLGAAVASGATALLANALGSWTAALAVWALPGGLAVASFVPIVRSESAAAADARRSAPDGRLWRDPGAWTLAVFFSLDNVLYFSQITWVAPLYVDLGWSAERAGFLLTVFLVAQLVGSIGISAVADRWEDRRPWLALSILLNAVGLVGFVWVPMSAPWGWALLAGLGLGGLFALILTLPVDLASNASVADRLTPMMLGVGYIAGSTGPFVVGWTRETLGSYDPAFVGLLGLCIAALVMTPWFRPDRTVAFDAAAGES